MVMKVKEIAEKFANLSVVEYCALPKVRKFGKLVKVG